jgi:hypothetical protein
MATSQRGHTYISPTVTADGRAHFGDVYGDVHNNCSCTLYSCLNAPANMSKTTPPLMAKPVQKDAGKISFSPTLRSTASAS